MHLSVLRKGQSTAGEVLKMRVGFMLLSLSLVVNEFAEIQLIASLRKASDITALYLSVLYSFWH